MDRHTFSKRSPRTPVRATDADGAAIVRVPLANTGSKAKLLAEDFDRLGGSAITSQWTLNENRRGGHGYVRCGCGHVPGGLVIVARLIMEPPPGFMVRYRDGDRMNLRRDNLCLVRGRAQGQEAAIMAGEAPVPGPSALISTAASLSPTVRFLEGNRLGERSS
ncbi:hypothetical protein [Roseomonas sp. BN140053]|uniref:hypothetical protein n=1 Tax=Roseomonas sp. BN140053 TaxID=3391898 RepID=UPI0039ECF681